MKNLLVDIVLVPLEISFYILAFIAINIILFVSKMWFKVKIRNIQ